MPWYAWLYLAALSALVISSAFDDLRTGDPLPVIVLDLVEACAYWIFLVLWYRDPLPEWSRAAVPILLIAAALWTTRRAREAFRRLAIRQGAELTAEEKRFVVRVGMIVGIILFGPAYAAGIGVVYRLIA